MLSSYRFRRLALLGIWPAGLIALAACADAESDDGEITRTSAQAVSNEAKAACSFHYDVAAMTGGAPSTGKGFYGSSYLFTDTTGDGKSDLVKSTAVDTVSVEKGSGSGSFAASGSVKLPAPPSGRTYVGLGLVAAGDFDGDGRGDVVALSTTALTGYPGGSWWGRFFFLHGTASGGLEVGAQTADVMTSGEGTNIHIAADFDGDGKDDFIYGNHPGQMIVFSNASRTISAATSVGLTGAGAVVGGAGGAALIDVSGTVANKLTWSSARVKSTQKLVAPSLSVATFSATYGGDLDGDGNLERFGRGSTNGGAPSLVVGSVGATTAPASTFYGVDSSVDIAGAFDLDADGKAELVYDEKGVLRAACGYVPGATDLVATKLGPTIDGTNTIASAGDINGDGRPDFVELDYGLFVSAYLSGPKPAVAAPLVTLSSTPPTPTPDAGKADAGGKPKKDAGADAGKGSSTGSPDDGEASGEGNEDDGAATGDGAAPAAAQEGGCAQSPRGRSSGGVLVGLGLALLVKRRTRRSSPRE